MRRSAAWVSAAALALVCVASGAAADEIRTLDGRTLTPAAPTGEFRDLQETLLAEALEARVADEGSVDAWIWVGRRQAYLGRYEEAIATYSEALERFAEDARLLRHRGHRYLSLRRLDAAVVDFELAVSWVEGKPDEVEPDGLPNDRGIPTSTLQTNIWYHLALARYLQGDFDGAASAWDRCLQLSTNDDMRVASAYWLYLSLRRAGQVERAAELLSSIEPGLDIIENDGYYELLLAFAGRLEASDLLTASESERGVVAYPTTAYGVGAWALINDRPDRALSLFEAILESSAVTAFGYIAAEAELAR